MRLRRAVALVLPLVFAACTEVDQKETPAALVFATFASPNIPQPNDLALQAAPTLTAPEQQAQKQLLDAFIAGGGFPSDQEVPVTVPFRTAVWDPNAGAAGAYVNGPAAIDLATVRVAPAANPTVAVLKVDATPVVAVDCDASFANSVLTLRKKADASGSRRWAPGRYVVAVRGGASGVKDTGGRAVQADQAILIAAQNKSLAVRENWPLGVTAASAAQLEAVRQILWSPLQWSNQGGRWAPSPSAAITPAFPAAKAAFGLSDAAVQTDIASLAAFGVAPAQTVVLVDSGSGVAPLPFDLLRTGPNGTIAPNPAFGAAGAGLVTLDGFSTTAMILAQTSAAVDASTVNGANVHVFKLTKDAAGAVTGVALVPELKRELGALGAGGNPASAGYVAQPSAIVTAQGAACPIAGGCSLVIGLQPSVPAATPAGNFFLPPLAENTSYAVVITKRVRDVANAPLGKTTAAKILTEVTAPVSAGGVSLLAGVDATTAGALQRMKTELAAVLQNLPSGTVAADVAAAWTFKTQSITGTSLALAAAPFSIERGASTVVFSPTALAPVTAPAGVPTAGVNGFYDVTFKGVDAIDKTTGAFRPTLAADLASPATLPALLTNLHALVAVPDAANVPLCPSPPFPAGARCAKLVVFGHGLGGSKETLFATASSLASRGFIAAAIDFPLHGGRAWCGSNADCTTGAADGVCTAFAGSAAQGDAQPPGLCTTGVPKAAVSGKYFVTANFFRIRDAFRQNILDQATLALALSRPPAPVPQPPQNPVNLVLPAGVIIDPSTVYYEGISLGSIAGTSVTAVNPRISRAALSVGGGTVVDVFTTAPAFTAQVDALFLGLGIDRSQLATNPAMAAAYLRTLNVAKWILDPGDPINYARSLRTAPLPNLLSPTPALQAPKDVFAQVALGDTVVPNAFNFELATVGALTTSTYVDDSPVGGPAPHSMLASIPAVQADAAGWLFDLTAPPATRPVPVLP
jgi:hypothetical protein